MLKIMKNNEIYQVTKWKTNFRIPNTIKFVIFNFLLNRKKSFISKSLKPSDVKNTKVTSLTLTTGVYIWYTKGRNRRK